eukprot:g13561.t1
MYKEFHGEDSTEEAEGAGVLEEAPKVETQAEIAARLAAEDIPVPHEYMPSFWALLALVCTFLVTLLLFFLQRWSVRIYTYLQFVPAPRLQAGTYALVIPQEHQGSAEVVRIEEITIDGKKVLFFNFHRQRFEVEEEKQRVSHLQSPIEWPVYQYVEATGIRSDGKAQSLLQRFGENIMSIPTPAFLDMYKERMLSPIPVFQIFAACLWLLDVYWNYALFNLFSIFMFEATTTFQRLKNLQMLRSMRNQKTSVLVYRAGQWKEVDTTQLLPTDLFSLRKSEKEDKGETVVPCDALILRGSAVVNESSLTGESTPQMKSALIAVGESRNQPLSIEHAHRVNVLYSGTVLNQHTGPAAESKELLTQPTAKTLVAPDGGCICFCLRTGFSSSQGKLIRMIEYSSESVMSDVKETLALLMLLLFFAILAAGYVMKKGLEDGKRSQYELVLRCVLILTAVVPPELPMQTAMAINMAVRALWQSSVFVTEPFRVPYAGRISYTLFDKTGTLTSDQLVTAGVTLAPANPNEPLSDDSMVKMRKANAEVSIVLAGCHSLVEVDGKLAGDPLEVAVVKSIGWTYNPKTNQALSPAAAPKPAAAAAGNAADKAKPKSPALTEKIAVEILHRYHFASRLQRMSVLARVRRPEGSKLCALVKGSPEVLKPLLAAVPSKFERCYRGMTAKGLRVLALARRELTSEESTVTANTATTGQSLPREQVERNLQFVGFVAFYCPVRSDTGLVVSELQAGGHVVIMVTGDGALTALHVAREVGIIKTSADKTLVLSDVSDSGSRAADDAPVPDGKLEWRSASQAALGDEDDSDFESKPFHAQAIPELVQQGFELCLTGATLRAATVQDDSMWDMVGHIKVFARMAPQDKERVLRSLKKQGHFTLMCGDGANDVGALKQAHIGLALLTGFGNSNASKAGDKVKLKETEEEEKSRLLEAKDRQHEITQKRNEEMAKNKQELTALQKVYVEEEMAKLGSDAGAWALWTAHMQATKRLVEETKKKNNEVAKKYGQMSLTAQAALLAGTSEEDATAEVPMVKLGDASVAAPFTSKLPSIKSTVDIIRQGRCTLVTTVQMQQILALNCLIAAYALSALYLDGVRSSEPQMIASGMLLTVASVAASYATPVKELSHLRPITSVFHPSIILSIMGQLIIHLSCMVYAISMVKAATPDAEDERFVARSVVIGENGEVTAPPFKPTLLNTVVVLVETAQHVAVLAVNYKGRPFMIATTENRPLMYSLAICCGGLFVAAFEVIPQLNKLLEMVPLPDSEFRTRLLLILFMSVGGTLVWDRLMCLLFAPDLLIQGTKDAWNAMPSFEKEVKWLGWWGGLAFLVLYLEVSPIILGIVYWLWRRRQKAAEEDKEKIAREERKQARLARQAEDD